MSAARALAALAEATTTPSDANGPQARAGAGAPDDSPRLAERGSRRSKAFDWTVILLGGGGLATLVVPYVEAGLSGDRTVAGIVCNDVQDEAVDEIAADHRDDADYLTSAVFRDGMWQYLSEDEREACPLWKDEILRNLEDLPPPS